MRPRAEPKWDTEYTALGKSVQLFYNNRAFSFPLLAKEAVDRFEKNLSDTSQLYSNSLVDKGCTFLADRVVLYPSTEGCADLDAYRRDVEEYRQSATLHLQFSDTIYSTFPLRDVMPNFAFYTDMKAREKREKLERRKPKRLRREQPNGINPLEAPYLTYRVGVDITVKSYSLQICESESFFLVARSQASAASVPRPVGVRAYLVGTHLRGVQG